MGQMGGDERLPGEGSLIWWVENKKGESGRHDVRVPRIHALPLKERITPGSRKRTFWSS